MIDNFCSTGLWSKSVVTVEEVAVLEHSWLYYPNLKTWIVVTQVEAGNPWNKILAMLQEVLLPSVFYARTVGLFSTHLWSRSFVKWISAFGTVIGSARSKILRPQPRDALLVPLYA